jgi:hypothetical protein
MDNKHLSPSPQSTVSNEDREVASQQDCVESTLVTRNTNTNNGRTNFKVTKRVCSPYDNIQQRFSICQLETDLPPLPGSLSPSRLSPVRTSELSTVDPEMPPWKKKDQKKGKNKNKKDKFSKADSRIPSSSKSNSSSIPGSSSTTNSFAPSATTTTRTPIAKGKAPASSIFASRSPTDSKQPASSFVKTDYNQDELEDVPLGNPPAGWVRGMDPTEDTDYDLVVDKNLKGAVGIVAQQGGKISKKGLLNWLFRK